MGARHCKAKESANKITFALLFIIAAYRRKDDERAHFIPEVRHSEPFIFAERKKKLQRGTFCRGDRILNFNLG
jgi:hypothetical protein